MCVRVLPAGMDAGGTPAPGCGGACARCGVVCPRTPRLTSALGPGWLRVGDMMFDGVFRQMVLRPLILLGRPHVGVGRQQSRRELAAVSSVDVGLAA